MEEASLEQLKEVLQRAKAEIAKVIIGQEDVVEMALVTIFTRSHALIEGVPGVAKTLLVRTLGATLDCESSRIQFTPDLMPADITGTNIFDMKSQEFRLVRGPVFTTLLLADEINRAPAKTQSALLQAMQERQVTIDRDEFTLNPHFTVFATQNPVEYEGTYPLPEAQKDRFMLKITMDYPDEADEKQLARRMLGHETPEGTLDKVEKVVSQDVIPQLMATLEGLTLREELVDYIVNIVRATRRNEAILVGAGPRATQALLLASRARAALDGRDYVTPDDVKRMALPVLGHRLVLRPEYEIEGLSVDEVVDRTLREVAVPR